ncbi:MAG: hypothetical protein DCC67_17610 [Planctomycetota bacterium]|nr:MAG: hypothetical protein DCC67_17610 [Planctomycetota bacterium]
MTSSSRLEPLSSRQRSGVLRILRRAIRDSDLALSPLLALALIDCTTIAAATKPHRQRFQEPP